ncbi:MAG: hypothetical protein ABI647_08270 [Gemmatimonadota bacterium]
MQSSVVRRRPISTSTRATLSRGAAALLALALIGMPACSGAIAPRPDLAGSWATLPNPAGGAWTLALTTSGLDVSGTGSARAGGSNGRVSPMVVTGTQGSGGFSLTITIASQPAETYTYTGTLESPDRLVGAVSTLAQRAGTLTLVRQ